MTPDVVAIAGLLIGAVGLLLKVISSYTGRVEKQIEAAATTAKSGMHRLEAENKALHDRVVEAEKALLWVAKSPRRSNTGRIVLSKLLMERDEEDGE